MIFPMHRGKRSTHARLKGWDQPVPQFNRVRTISERARHVIAPFLDGVADVLPFAPSAWGQFYAVHVHREIDCFDEERASFDRFPSSGRLWHVFRWAFQGELLPRNDKVFRIPQRFWPIVSQPFVDAVESAGLTGFRFHLLWDEDLDEQPDQTGNTWAQ